MPLFIKLESNGPIFFTQVRVGYHGRKFKLYKFRTMVNDAESKLDDLTKMNEQSGPVLKWETIPE